MARLTKRVRQRVIFDAMLRSVSTWNFHTSFIHSRIVLENFSSFVRGRRNSVIENTSRRTYVVGIFVPYRVRIIVVLGWEHTWIETKRPSWVCIWRPAKTHPSLRRIAVKFWRGHRPFTRLCKPAWNCCNYKADRNVDRQVGRYLRSSVGEGEQDSVMECYPFFGKLNLHFQKFMPGFQPQNRGSHTWSS